MLIATGKGLGQQIWSTLKPSLPKAQVFTVAEGTLAAASDLQSAFSAGSFDAVVGVGGGRTLDVTKYAATRTAVPMVAVATNLAHDGICSPVSSLEIPEGKGSFGVALPLAVVVDLDYVLRAPRRMVSSGIGDTISNLSAIEDWDLARRVRGEPVDGLAVTFSRTAAESILHRHDTIDDPDFLTALAESLVLSGMAMSVAGTSRPCSGACHEVVHAVDQLHPGTSNHGELAGVGALFATFLRGNQKRAHQISTCLTRHQLPRTPTHLGLTPEAFAVVIQRAPQTRPGRYTIIEHLELDYARTRQLIEEFCADYDA